MKPLNLLCISVLLLLLIIQGFSKSEASTSFSSVDGVTTMVELSKKYHYLPKINCKKACSRRCSKASRKKICMRACGTCCSRCHCVPPGTYGNHQLCPCYARLKTHGNKPKCP